MINKKKGETKHWQQSQTYKHVLYVPRMYLRSWCNHKSAGLYHFLKTFSGKSAAHEWSLLVLLLVIWAADFSWVLTCAVWLHAEVMLFSLSALVLLRGNVLWTCTSALTMRTAQDESMVWSGQHTTLLLRVGVWEGGGGWQMCRHIGQIYEFWHFFQRCPDSWRNCHAAHAVGWCVSEFSQSCILSNRILISGSSPYDAQITWLEIDFFSSIPKSEINYTTHAPQPSCWRMTPEQKTSKKAGRRRRIVCILSAQYVRCALHTRGTKLYCADSNYRHVSLHMNPYAPATGPAPF